MKIALVQINSQLDYRENLATLRELLPQIHSAGVNKVFLPECFYSMGDGHSPTPYRLQLEPANDHLENVLSLAKEFQMYLLGGTVVVEDNQGAYWNTCLNVTPKGRILNSYRKIHLFKCLFTGKDQHRSLDESQVYQAGQDPLTFCLDGLKLGVSICFDLRFPELYRYYHKQGVEVISVSSAFTDKTGSAHWEVLLRARAIENQCYIVASNQVGRHNDKMISYGHSMVVSPWGEVLLDLQDKVGFGILELDRDLVGQVRSRMDVSQQIQL
jgi:predicted amidohydrolase